ncbi:unnamed protein product [Mortierella alpina]
MSAHWGDLASDLLTVLPYSHALASEAADMLDNIVHHFGLSLQSEDWAPGALYWAKQLNQYLDLKYTLPKETRIAFAKVFWELTIAPGMDVTMVEAWSVFCRRLIKKKDLIGPKDLTLPWRPIYDILERILFPKNRQRALLSESKRMSRIVRLVDEAQRFFPPEAAGEILEEFIPKMDSSNLPELLKAQSYLCTFLPTDMESGMDPREWMPAIFRLWSMVAHSSEFDRNFLSLLGRVARDNVGIKDMFTPDQARTVYSMGLSALSLPVGKGQRANSVDAEGGGSHKAVARNDLRMGSFAMFIVHTINPAAESLDPKSSSLAHFGDLIQATESFYHPSNSGQWSYTLSLFLQLLAWEYLQRLNEEKQPKCKTPQELRLTPEINNKFVQSVKGVVFLMMFSKDQRAAAQTQLTLRYLAWIAPKLIIPGILENAYPSLESLTETHRTTSVIPALGSIAVPLLNREHFPQGGKHLTPLLHLTVPGVDLNDPAKTWYTLLFVASMAATVPIRDLTEMGSAGFQWGGMEEDMLDADEMVDMDLEDATRKATTSEFEEWLMKFLRRTIAMFANYPDVGQGKKADSVEGHVTKTISYCFEILFGQLSPKMYDMTTKLVIEQLESSPMTNAGKAMGAFVQSWAAADRKRSMGRVFEVLNRLIRSEIEHGASSVPSLVDSHLHRDDSLHYNQGLLNHLLRSSELMGHKQDVMSLTQLMMDKCQDRQGYKLTGKTVVSLLQNLLGIYLLDLRSHDPAQWNDAAFMAESHKHWGTLKESGNDQFNWHVPSQDEINFGIELVETFHLPAMRRARELMTSTMLEGKQLSIEFCKTITTIKAFVTGMVLLVEDDGDSPISKASMGEDTASIQPLKRLEVGYCLTDSSDPRTERIRKIRAETGELLHELLVFFQTKREDDVENIKILVKAARVFLGPWTGKQFTELHDKLIMDLTELSLSQYTDVRKKSQHALLKAVRCFQGAKNLVIPTLLQALESSNTDYEKMKGALYLLSARTLTLPCLRDWRFVPDYVLRLCTAHHADKPSVQALVRKCFLEYIINLTHTSFKVLTTTHFVQTVDAFKDKHGLVFDSDTASRAANKAKNRRLNSVKAYDNLLVSLTELVRDENLHWRYQTMTMSFIEVLMRPEIACSLEIAEFEAKSLLSEMPTVRRIALSSLTTIMVNLKIRAFAQGDAYSLIVRRASHPLRRQVSLPEKVPQDFTWEYLKSSVAEIDYDHPEANLLNDSGATGWLAWPKTFRAYLPRTNSFVMPEIDAESRPAYEHLGMTFQKPLFWETLVEYMAQEPVRGERHDAFSSEHARLYKSMFGLWEERLLAVVEPVVTKLCSRVDDKNAQRTAAELIGGMIRGSKHWKKEGLDRMWAWLSPLLKKTFHQCTPDSLVYWERFVKYACFYRDPRRVLPLITLIFGTTLDKESTAAFSESKVMFFTRAVLVSFSWRVSLLTPALRFECLQHIAHPYKQVREILGPVINELYQLASHPSYASVDEFLKAQKQGVSSGARAVDAFLNEKPAREIQDLVQNLDKWRVERPPAIQGASEYTNAGKTVLAWVFQALSGHRVQATYGVVLPLIPELFQMQDIPDDQDLQQLATLSLLQLARFVYPAQLMPQMVDLFYRILKDSTSWHVRSNVLPVVQIFFYTNLFSMDVAMMVKVMDAVSGMLLDPQIEVRQLAASTLSGIVRCSQRDATQALIKHFKDLLQSTPLPARRKRDRAGPKDASSSSLLPEGYSEALVKRHAGVLGLSSLLEAFPYDIPKWMPEVMVFLSAYFSDPPPVSTTVKKVFGDFKRTHQDTWHEDQKRFSQEELEVLSDMLISPSYYA